MIEISKGYAHWDIDNPELSNFYTASTFKCLNALAFGSTSHIINTFFLFTFSIYIFYIHFLYTFEKYYVSVSSLSSKWVVGKILLDFFVRACTSWFAVCHHSSGCRVELPNMKSPRSMCTVQYTFNLPFNQKIFPIIAQNRITKKRNSEMKFANMIAQNAIFSLKNVRLGNYLSLVNN